MKKKVDISGGKSSSKKQNGVSNGKIKKIEEQNGKIKKPEKNLKERKKTEEGKVSF